MTLIHKILNFLKKKKYLYGAVALVLLLGGLIIFNKQQTKEETVLIKHADFINQVYVSGKVVADSDVSLGFSQGGRIASVRFKVGDIVKKGTVLATVENGDAQADLLQKEAILEKEQTTLKSLKLGTRPEQIAITESSVSSAKTTFNQAKQGVINSINDAYTKSDDAIKNKIDQFFRNPLSRDPYILIYVDDNILVSSVNKERVLVGDTLTSWEKSVAQINSITDLENYIVEAEKNMLQLKSFLAKVSLLTNDPDATYNNASISSTWKADTSTARLAIDTAILNLASDVTTYKNAQADLITKQNNLKLEQAGSTVEDVEAQEAEVKGAEAGVVSARANLHKTLIIAPFDGIITKIDAKIGEVAPQNTALVHMMSVGTFQIESYVPEINIALIKSSSYAKVTLDAYGENVLFDAQVVSIDPAETIRDGVSTYKVKLQFLTTDDRIKSGMTANVSIEIFNKPNVIVVPGGVIFDKDGQKFVQVKKGDKIQEQEVTLGGVSALGQVEVVSGLSDGDLVILNPEVK